MFYNFVYIYNKQIKVTYIMKNKKSYGISITPELLEWTRKELPHYQLTISSFVHRCFIMFKQNKEFKDLLLKQFYEEIGDEKGK